MRQQDGVQGFPTQLSRYLQPVDLGRAWRVAEDFHEAPVYVLGVFAMSACRSDLIEALGARLTSRGPSILIWIVLSS